MIAYSRGSRLPGWCGFDEAPHTGDLGVFRTRFRFSTLPVTA